MSASNISAVTKSVSGAAVSGRSRLMGVYFVNLVTSGSNTQGSVNIRNGAAVSDSILFTLNASTAAAGTSIDIPDGGMLFSGGMYIDIPTETPPNSITHVTLLFEGGAAA